MKTTDYEKIIDELKPKYKSIRIKEGNYAYSEWKRDARNNIVSLCQESDYENLAYLLKDRARGRDNLKEMLFSVLYPIYMLVLPYLIEYEMIHSIYQQLDESVIKSDTAILMGLLSLFLFVFGVWEAFVNNRDKHFYEDLLDVVESMM